MKQKYLFYKQLVESEGSEQTTADQASVHRSNRINWWITWITNAWMGHHTG